MSTTIGSALAQVPRLVKQGPLALFDMAADLGRIESFLDAVEGVERGRVVLPAERLADLGVGSARVLAAEVHRDLPGKRDLAAALRRLQVRDLDVEVPGDRLHDRVAGEDLALARDDILQYMAGEIEGDRLTLKVCVGADADETPLELADVRLDG